MSAEAPFDRNTLRGVDETTLMGRAEACSPDDEADEYWAVVHELQQRGSRAVFDWAAAMLRHDRPERRRLACDVLAQLGYDDGHPFRERTVGLVEGLCADTDLADVSVLAAAISALGHGGQASSLPVVLGLAGHPDPNVRFAVASALPALIGSEWVEPDHAGVTALLALCDDPVDDVRDWATFGIGAQLKVDGPAIRRCLRARLDDPDEGARAEALAGLARRHDRGVAAYITRAVTGEAVARPVVEAAGWLADPTLHAPLEKLRVWWDLDAQLIAESSRRCAPSFVPDLAAAVAALLAAADDAGLAISVSSELLGHSPEGPVVQLLPADSTGYGLEPLLKRAGGSAAVAVQLMTADAQQSPSGRGL